MQMCLRQIWKAEMTIKINYSPLYGIHEDIAGAQCLVWNFSVKERAWQTVGTPVQGQQDGWELQSLVKRERPKGLSLCNLK